MKSAKPKPSLPCAFGFCHASRFIMASKHCHQPTTSIFLSLGHLLITHFSGWDLCTTSTEFSMHKNWRRRSNFFQLGPLSSQTKILIYTALWILVREWEGDLYRSNKLRICKFLQIASKRRKIAFRETLKIYGCDKIDSFFL